MVQPTYEYSGVCYTAASGQTIFALTSTDGNPIGYLSPDHIHVRTSVDSGATWVPLPANTAWTFADPATSIVLVTPATAGEWVDIQRKTPIDKDWVDFQAGSLLTAGQLNDAETFSLYCDQEIADDVGNITPPEIGLATTDDLPEGQTNLYYTDARVAEYIADNPIEAGVTRIIPGANITISPTTGVGDVIVNSTGGGGGGGIIYKGTIDATGPAPVNPQDGDFWINTTAGTADDSWTGIGGVAVSVGERLIYGTSNWEILPTPPSGVESVNGQTGVAIIGVEQLDDFAYYPDSQQVTLVGPNVADLQSEPNPTNAEYQAGIHTNNEIWILYLASNTAQNAVFEQLSEGNEVTLCYYVQHEQTGEPVYLELACTFKEFGPNTGSDPLESWLQLNGTFASSVPIRGDYPMVIKSPFISNGFKPITTGQALIYDQTTAKWRPEDIASELNISALPVLP